MTTTSIGGQPSSWVPNGPTASQIGPAAADLSNLWQAEISLLAHRGSMATSSSSSVIPGRWLVQVCRHRSCDRGGSEAVLAAFCQHQSPRILVAESDCMGQCSAGPTVKVMPGNTWYCRVTSEDVPRIVEQHLGKGELVRDRLHPRFHPPDSL